MQLADKYKVVDNYEKLSDKQNTIVPNDSITLAHQYLLAKLDLASDTRESDTQSRPDSKN